MAERPQFTEGQRVRGRNGEIAVIRNGVPVVENIAPPSIAIGPPNPRAPIDLRRAGAEADTATATAPYAGPRAAADAAAAEATAAAAARQALRGDRTPQQRDALLGRWHGIGLFERQLADLERQYHHRFENSGGILGMGEDRNITGLIPNRMNSENEQFNAAADSLIGTIANVQGTTGGEMNSLAELRARFGPMVPSSADSDATIVQKIATLRQMASSQRTELRQLLGSDLPADGTPPAPTASPQGPTGAPDGREAFAADLQARLLAGEFQRPEDVVAYGRDHGGFVVDPAEAEAAIRAVRSRQPVRVIPNQQGDAATVGSAAAPYPEADSVDSDSFLAQGLSGVNEGIASTLGAPVDLSNLLYGTALHGVNAVAGTDLQPSDTPFLGGEMWRSLLTSAGSIAPPSESTGRPFVRRVGQSLGAAAVPIAGTAGTVRRAAGGFLTAAGGGAGAATAQEVAPGNPVAELAGEVIGSAGSGASLFGLARRRAAQTAQAAVPSVAQLRQQAGDLYTAAESRGVVAGPNVTADVAGRIRDIARREELVTPTGRVSEAYPRAAEAMKLLDDYAGVEMNPRQIQVIRETLGDAIGATQGKERRIASMMLSAFDEATVPLAPELAQARDVASRYLQAGKVQRAIDLAEPRAAGYTQSGSGNALRAEFRNLDRRMIRGQDNFDGAVQDGPVQDAIERVSRGDWRTNILRNIGRLAPKGPVSMGMSGGVPFLIGNAMGGPVVGAAASAGTMVTGAGAHFLANRATTNQARIAEMLARAGGEIPAEPVMTPEVQRMIAAMLAGQTANASADY